MVLLPLSTWSYPFFLVSFVEEAVCLLLKGKRVSDTYIKLGDCLLLVLALGRQSGPL